MGLHDLFCVHDASGDAVGSENVEWSGLKFR